MYQHKDISYIEKTLNEDLISVKVYKTDLLITNKVFIFMMAKLNQFFPHVSEGLNIFLDEI